MSIQKFTDRGTEKQLCESIWANFDQKRSEHIPDRLSHTTSTGQGSISISFFSNPKGARYAGLRLHSIASPLGVLHTDTGERLYVALGSFKSLLSFDVFFINNGSASEIVQQPVPQKTKVCINIYGPKDAETSKSVGQALCRSKLFLHLPDILDSSIKYDNPHYFKSPLDPVCPRAPEPEKSTPIPGAWDILESLDLGSSLSGQSLPSPDPRMASQLLPYIPRPIL